MMTREEAVERLERLKRSCRDLAAGMPEEPGWALHGMALDMALTALRPVNREKVGKVWKGEWKIVEYEFFTCARCGDSYYNGAESTEQAESYLNSRNVYDFCPNCGAPMTDEAVEMVMERLEALKDG